MVQPRDFYAKLIQTKLGDNFSVLLDITQQRITASQLLDGYY
jgi:hypothetical protein